MALQDRHLLNRILAYEQHIRRDMRINAQAAKSWAQSQSRPLDELRDIHCIANAIQYIALIDRVNALPQAARDAVRALLTVAERTELTDSLVGMRQAAVALRDAPYTSYADVVTACNAVLASVTATVSLD